jgi:DNA-3-methyladenine glycosylase II
MHTDDRVALPQRLLVPDNSSSMTNTEPQPIFHTFLIEPRPPFRLDLTAWALRRRAHNVIDRWDGLVYQRVMAIDEGAPIAIAAREQDIPGAPRLSVTLAGRSIDPPTELLARKAVERLLGPSLDLSAFSAMAEFDPLLAPLAARMRGLKPPRFPTVFEALVNGVACQQLSLAVGIHLLNRLTATYGRPMVDAGGDASAFPGPEQLAGLRPDELRRHGFSLAKARTIVDAARAIVSDELDLESLHELDDQVVMERLIRLRGVGRWTAEYVMLRGLGRLEVFPGDDVGAHNKLRRFFDIDETLDYDAVKRLVARWQPFAGMVYFHLLLESLSESGFVTAD